MFDVQSGIMEWGAAMRLARKAAALAVEEQRAGGHIKDPLESAILIYTDDPTTAWMFFSCSDLAAICNTSAIEGIRIVAGDRFPPASHEAPRDDLELPRVAALFFRPPGDKCPRCRRYVRSSDAACCTRCTDQSQLTGETT